MCLYEKEKETTPPVVDTNDARQSSSAKVKDMKREGKRERERIILEQRRGATVISFLCRCAEQ